MWWIILGIVGLLVLVLALCATSGIADESAYATYQKTHRSDDDGNN